MSMVIDEHGSRLGKSGRSLYVKTVDGRVVKRSMYNLNEVIVAANCSISTQAIELLALNGVPLVLIKRGTPYAILHPFFHHGTVHTRREQLAAYLDHRGIYLARTFVIGSMRNRRSILQYFANNRQQSSPNIAERLEGHVTDIRNIEAELETWTPRSERIDGVRSELMGFEAHAAKSYFAGLKEIIPEKFNFDGRERRPPKDPVNSLLSYGYTILYSRILTAIAACGLEPFAGFLHADRSGKPSLVLDMVEEFRQVAVDRLVIRMLMLKQLSPEDFVADGTRVIMSDDARRKFLSELIEGFNSNILHKGKKQMTMTQAMVHQARGLVRYLIGKEKEYQPYVFRW